MGNKEERGCDKIKKTGEKENGAWLVKENKKESGCYNEIGVREKA